MAARNRGRNAAAAAESGAAATGRPGPKGSGGGTKSSGRKNGSTPGNTANGSGSAPLHRTNRNRFISQAAIAHLQTYRYKAGEYSKLDLQMNGFWVQVAAQIPRNVSPNMVTFTGFVGVVFCKNG